MNHAHIILRDSYSVPFILRAGRIEDREENSM